MQAILEPQELAYLLQSLGAEQVVGVDNRQLFPDDAAIRTAWLESGFAALQEHGWIVAEGEGAYNTNDQIMLTAAVMAEPVAVMTVTFRSSPDGRYYLTYYVADSLIVEQFMTPEGGYLLTQVASSDIVIERLKRAFGLSRDIEVPPITVELDAVEFARALSAARKSELDTLRTLLLEGGLTKRESVLIARQISNVSVVGHIEGAALASGQAVPWMQLSLVRAAEGSHWLIAYANSGMKLLLAACTEERFEQQVMQLWHAITPTAMQYSS